VAEGLVAWLYGTPVAVLRVLAAQSEDVFTTFAPVLTTFQGAMSVIEVTGAMGAAAAAPIYRATVGNL
jgi:hypothetical protein